MRGLKAGYSRIRGVSLAEVMIALLLLLYMCMVVSGMFFQTAQLEKKDTAITEATYVCMDVIELIKREVSTGDQFNNLVSSTDYRLPQDNDDSPYVYDVEVDEVSNSLKYIRINVYYRNIKSADPEPDITKPNLGRLVRLGTLIRKP